MALVYCHNCGKVCTDRDDMCPECGAPNRVVRPSGPRKSWTAALLLCLFLGGMGAHRFYLRKFKTATMILLVNFSWIMLILGNKSAIWRIMDTAPAIYGIPISYVIIALAMVTAQITMVVDFIRLLNHGGDDDYVTRIAYPE